MELALDQEVGLDEGYGIPENDHIAVMFKALGDSHEQSLAGVTGEENLSLAQVYAAGVLSNYSSGRVAGNESVFSSVGDGFKKVWDYIKGMFSNLWNFFFKKETADKAEEKAEEVDKEARELNSIVIGDPNAEDVEVVMDRILESAKLDGQEIKIDNKSHKEFLDSLKGASESESEAAIKMVFSALKKNGSDRHSRLKKVSTELKNNNISGEKRVLAALEKLDKSQNLNDKQMSVYKSLKPDVEHYVKVSKPLVEQIYTPTQTPDKAYSKVVEIKAAIKKLYLENGRIIKRFSNAHNNNKGLIADLEAKLKVKGIEKEQSQQIKAELKGLNDLVSMFATVASSIKGSNNRLDTLNKTYNSLFGYK